MRVLAIDPSNRAPLYFEQFVYALAERVDLKAIAPRRADEIGITRADASNVWIWHGPGEGPLHARVAAYLKTWLLALSLASRFDVVHIQWLAGLDKSELELYLLRLLLQRNRRVAYTVHNLLPHRISDVKRSQVTQRFRWVYENVPLLFVHSARTREELIQSFRVPESRITVVPHGPLLASEGMEATAPAAQIQYDVAMIGRVSPYKGAEDAISALALVKTVHPNARLLLAGVFDPDYKRVLLERSRSLGLEECITIMDRKLTNLDVITLHRQSAMTILPYRKISQSGAALTALGLGVPIVCYDVGGLRDTVRAGVNGYVVPEGDIEELARKVAVVMENREVFRAGAKAMQGTVSWQETARRSAEAYAELLMKGM